MKLTLALIVVALSSLGMAQTHHKTSWLVHHKNGTVSVAHRRVSSWHVKGHVTKRGTWVRGHADHARVYKRKG